MSKNDDIYDSLVNRSAMVRLYNERLQQKIDSELFDHILRTDDLVKSKSQKIAKWNGTNWQPMGAGLDSIVTHLAADSSGNVYATGWFTMSGETLKSIKAPK